MIRYSRANQVRIPLSPESLAVLDEFGPDFRGRWSLLETAVVSARRRGIGPDPSFHANGIRPAFRTEVDLLRAPELRWEDLGVSDGRIPGAIGGILHSEMRAFRERSRHARPYHPPEPSSEVTVTLPSSSLLELKVSAYRSGVDLYSEVSRRLEVSCLRAAGLLGDLSGSVNEIPVRIPRSAFEAAHQAARVLGSKAIALATQQMVLDLAHEAEA